MHVQLVIRWLWVQILALRWIKIMRKIIWGFWAKYNFSGQQFALLFWFWHFAYLQTVCKMQICILQKDWGNPVKYYRKNWQCMNMINVRIYRVIAVNLLTDIFCVTWDFFELVTGLGRQLDSVNTLLKKAFEFLSLATGYIYVWSGTNLMFTNVKGQV